MTNKVLIPMFPLSLLPLPGEMVPLHIFEPRYRQLFREAEENDISFGIFFSSDINLAQIGSLMKLESVIKRYPQGESDVITKCIDIFSMTKLHHTFKNKMYPGGDIERREESMANIPSAELRDLFNTYFVLRNISNPLPSFNIYQIANELALTISERYKFLTNSSHGREIFLSNKLRFTIRLLEQERKSKDVFHLN